MWEGGGTVRDKPVNGRGWGGATSQGMGGAGGGAASQGMGGAGGGATSQGMWGGGGTVRDKPVNGRGWGWSNKPGNVGRRRHGVRQAKDDERRLTIGSSSERRPMWYRRGPGGWRSCFSHWISCTMKAACGEATGRK